MAVSKYPVFFAIFLGLGTALAGCSKATDPWEKVPGGPTKVLVTIPPLYSFAKNVAGEDAAVLCLLGSKGPHGYEPVAADSLKAKKADVFFAIGLGLDEFTGKIVNSSGNKKVKVVEVGEQAGAIKEEKDDKEEKGGHDHRHGDSDPHVWLGIPESIKMVNAIRDSLQEIDPKNKDSYAKRAAVYVKEMEKLLADGKAELKSKKNKKLIATHESLRYFGKSFGLEILDSIQPRPGIEADSAQMTKLAKLMKEKDVRVIATEPQYPHKLAEVLKANLAKQKIEVKLVEIDPLETAPADELDAGYYLKKMRDNITNLAKALP
ncbi:MAG TPA: zinc ABC transporter substrate-binding protein [Gemmataceae bacterium]|nr:zinc ABC transporter substrate-binding protein [Gemmataceae bacterium]